jgi:beta-lactamase superfamily II metal-dependent hydrolase
MPWELEIHTIDVGQGESSLIIARNIIARNPTIVGQERSMLIDAGLPIHAQTVHNYITQPPPNGAGLVNGVDHILISHYDKDHSGGVLDLLRADNLYRVCDELAQAAGNAAAAAAANGVGVDNQIAAAAGAVSAAMQGAYNLGPPKDYAVVAVNAGITGQNLNLGNVPSNNNAIADEGASAAGDYNVDLHFALGNTLNDSIVKVSTATKQKIWREAGIAAGETPGLAAARINAARIAVLNILTNSVPTGSQFNTNGIYRNTQVIDIGDTPHLPGNYINLVKGSCEQGSTAVWAPGINRARTSLAPANLGNEILWGTGVGAAAPPAGAPAIFVVACRKHVWNAPGGTTPIASGQSDNDDSIGLILRFNKFFYYTGGDLPSQGEDLIANAIMAIGLPNPAGGAAFAVPDCIACFKCGHHGSSHSTSQTFLNDVQPRGALISSGKNAFGTDGDGDHPTQDVIDRLHNNVDIQKFYLTNCYYTRNSVPASQAPPQTQLVGGNKSRLAGDNAEDNLQIGRDRGNITLFINQAESTSIYLWPLVPPPGQTRRQYRIQYYEADKNPGAGLPNIRVENIVF